MNKKLFYPSIFHKIEEGGFWISFPNLSECLTEINNMQKSYEMAVDALVLCLAIRKEESIAKRINFSQVLQEALTEHLKL